MGYAYMNQPCSCSVQTARMPSASAQAQPASAQTGMAQAAMPSYSFYCPNTAPGGIEQSPVGMGYVPWQQWQQTYPLEQGFSRGTIFPDLDLPFAMGRCIRS